MLWNLECPVRLNQREICAHFNEGNLRQFGRSAEKLRIVELRSEIILFYFILFFYNLSKLFLINHKTST